MILKKTDLRKDNALKRAEEVLGEIPTVFDNPLTVLASPAWRGIEGDIWRASSADRSIILKHYHSDTEFYVDTSAAIKATEQAGILGIGPLVLMQWYEEGIFATNDLGTEWRAGGLHDVVDSEIRNNIISQKKTFQQNATLENKSDIFLEIESLFSIVDMDKIFTHRDIHHFLLFFRESQKKIEAIGRDSKPCHRDGNTANLMIGSRNKVQLLDFDLAANCDPFEDVGCYLAEFYESDTDARAGFEEWYGTFDEGLFQRSRIYGLADDMRWGLIAAILAAQSSRSALEFSKYSAWRFLRLEGSVKRSSSNDRIRVLA